MSIKEDILAAGVVLLRERGIAALTQPQVAKAAGVKQSHLTYYFPTRADLLLGIAEQSITEVMTNLTERMTRHATPATLAATFVEVMIDGVPPRVMIGLIVAADADPKIRQHMRKLTGDIRRRIVALLEKSGLADAENAALLFHAAVVGLAVMHQARLNRESAREVKAGIAAMLHLLAPREQEA